jgi:SAM-dependent methyltransferase
VSEVKTSPVTYLRKRAANNAFWSKRALRRGTSLAATDSTNWVRASSLRRLRNFVRPEHRVLEVGCGNGSSLLGALSKKCHAYGVDLTFEMLTVAKQHSSIEGLALSDACDLPFRDQSFDVVYTSRCLINVLDAAMQRQAMAELFRVVKKNGTVILIENFAEALNRLNRSRKRLRAGPPIVDAHNLPLNFEDAIDNVRQFGWRPTVVMGNTIASIVSHIIIPGITRDFGNWWIERLLYPLYVMLTRVEDAFGNSKSPWGKDVLIAFQRDPSPPEIRIRLHISRFKASRKTGEKVTSPESARELVRSD